MKNVLMLHGINHNIFGRHDPAQYGTVTLVDIDARLLADGSADTPQVQVRQLHDEGGTVTTTPVGVSPVSACRWLWTVVRRRILTCHGLNIRRSALRRSRTCFTSLW